MYNNCEGLKEGLLIFDDSESLIYVNNCLLNILNYDNDKHISGGIHKIINDCNGIKRDLCSELIKNKGKHVKLTLLASGNRIVNARGKIEQIDVGCQKIYIIHIDNNNEIYIKNREMEIELELFLNTAVDLIAIINPDLTFSKVNSRWTKSLGWSIDELMGMHVSELVCKDDLDTMITRAINLKSDEKLIRYKNRYKCKDGSFRWFEWRSRYIKEVDKYACTATDITDTIEIQEKTKNFEKQLELEKLKSEIFSNVSHEFKTPLNIITATAQLIEKNIEDKNIVTTNGFEISNYINSIKKNAYRLIKMVNNVVDRSKIDAGYYRIHLENKDFIEIVEDITMSVVQYAENKGITLIFDTEIEELKIAVDSEKIERVMLNLLSNAIKHTEKGGKINVIVQCEDGFVKVSVTDNGCGIPEDKLPGIFERFVQVDSDSYKRSEGSGIGLSLVKSLVEMHDGQVWAESQFGKGSNFIFKIPIKVVDKVEASGASIHSANSKAEKCIVEFSDMLN